MCAGYVSNPFQVLGVSDPPSAAPAIAAPPAQANGMHAGGGPMMAGSAPTPAPTEKSSFLHHLGHFFVKDALPLVAELGIQLIPVVGPAVGKVLDPLIEKRL
jgi:hypothetical protein